MRFTHKIPKDNQLHLLVGFAISLITLLITQSTTSALVLGALSGLAKELYDMTGRGTPELADFVYTVVGALPPVIYTSLVFNY